MSKKTLKRITTRRTLEEDGTKRRIRVELCVDGEPVTRSYASCWAGSTYPPTATRTPSLEALDLYIPFRLHELYGDVLGRLYGDESDAAEAELCDALIDNARRAQDRAQRPDDQPAP